MSKLSRPFQLALVAMGVLVAVWFVALRGHSTSTASPSATATPASATTTDPGAPSAIYHGSAPGVGGLTRAIAKAHEAVAESESNAKQLAEKSAQASSITPAAATATGTTAGGQSSSGTDKPTTTHAAATGAAAPATSTHSAAASKPAATSKAAPQGTGSPATRANAVPALQTQVEQQLAQDGTVIVLFWNPTGADDVYVRHQLQLLQAHNRHIAVHLALANEVASYGSITRSVQIVGTPTTLIITRDGKAKTLTGLWDTYSIQQAIGEARE